MTKDNTTLDKALSRIEERVVLPHAPIASALQYGIQAVPLLTAREDQVALLRLVRALRFLLNAQNPDRADQVPLLGLNARRALVAILKGEEPS